MKLIRDFYFSVFILFFNIGRDHKSNPSDSDLYRGVAGISTILSALFAAALILADLPGLTARSGKWVAGFAGLFIYLINGYFLIIRGHGGKFERDFCNFSFNKKLILYFVAAVVTLSSLTTAYCAATAHRRMLGIS